MKAFADDKLKVIQIAKFVLDKIETFPTMFSRWFFFKVVESQDCVVKGYPFTLQLLNLTHHQQTAF